MARSKIALIFTVCMAALMVGCSQQNGPRPPMVAFKPSTQQVRPRSVSQMKSEVRIRREFMSPSCYARRHSKPMKPRFITIHSTANRTAGAMQHRKALGNGALGKLNWHFTVDQYMAVQNIPLNETGRHADKGGPGDRYSIGIEMCENESRGRNYPRTWDRAAKLTATLMKEFDISLRNVVPHYFWTRKNCPEPLLEGGRPGYKWAWFKSRVDYYYRCINNGRSNLG